MPFLKRKLQKTTRVIVMFIHTEANKKAEVAKGFYAEKGRVTYVHQAQTVRLGSHRTDRYGSLGSWNPIRSCEVRNFIDNQDLGI